MRELAPGLHVTEAPQRFFGLEIGARMTVLQLADGLLVHSPIAVDPSSITHLGTLRWVVAPNKFHHLHVGPWIEAGAEAWAPPGLHAKRSDLQFTGVLEPGVAPFGDEVAVVPLKCMPLTEEVVLLHRPTRTLVLTDLAFHMGDDAPLVSRLAMRFALGYPGFRSTVIERVAMNRATAREELNTLLALDFDRVIVSHGEVLETGGKRALADAFAWLGLDGT